MYRFSPWEHTVAVLRPVVLRESFSLDSTVTSQFRKGHAQLGTTFKLMAKVYDLFLFGVSMLIMIGHEHKGGSYSAQITYGLREGTGGERQIEAISH